VYVEIIKRPLFKHIGMAVALPVSPQAEELGRLWGLIRKNRREVQRVEVALSQDDAKLATVSPSDFKLAFLVTGFRFCSDKFPVVWRKGVFFAKQHGDLGVIELNSHRSSPLLSVPSTGSEVYEIRVK